MVRECDHMVKKEVWNSFVSHHNPQELLIMFPVFICLKGPPARQLVGGAAAQVSVS